MVEFPFAMFMPNLEENEEVMRIEKNYISLIEKADSEEKKYVIFHFSEKIDFNLLYIKFCSLIKRDFIENNDPADIKLYEDVNTKNLYAFCIFDEECDFLECFREYFGDSFNVNNFKKIDISN